MLVDQLIRREINRYFDQFLVDIENAETAADRAVLGFVSALGAFRRNPLIGGLMAAETTTSSWATSPGSSWCRCWSRAGEVGEVADLERGPGDQV